MKTYLTRLSCVFSLLVLTGVLLPLHPAAAQAVQPTIGTSDIRSGISASDSELTPTVQAHVTLGDRLTGMRRYGAAEQEYRSAAAIARRQGHLPSLTLWHLASAYFYEGDLQRAAVVLDQLRVEAAQSGDVAVEALALFNAAWLNGQAGRRRDAGTRVADLRRLLGSPYMPAAVRSLLSKRLETQTDLAVQP